ncbi:MarR family winged helix-turn-helix transcriptional regulator [Sphingomonas colocasiae]|uniref:MarR family transcriptional regulator n=1 Tax=Sphingomonas colocasiae TaxID=1848973 RepID=A0ABS7PSU4_9SPHN|nr:MarR family transcriptional regulator [Sphingomonas colocasiae]MBY8824410.1 MarR family transcriptional regulator [Sphingomonas colocasiae]
MMDLLRAYYWFDEALQAGLKQHGWGDVTRSQSLILSNVAFGVRRASQLAKNLGVTRQAISQMLTEMERKELITMSADPSDGRAQIVNFSTRSQGIRDDAMKILNTIEARLGEQLGKRRFEALTEALSRDWGPPAFVDQ